jgi:hypothetical protein
LIYLPELASDPTAARPSDDESRSVGNDGCGDYLGAVTEAMDWIQTFVASPHPDLGRAGAVCPYVHASLDKDMIHVACRTESDCADPALRAAIERSVPWFTELLRRTPEATRHLTVLLFVLPLVDRVDPRPIKALHAVLKDHLVKRGLMIGVFYPTSTEPSRWNPEFRPSQSPVPFFAIREMIASDLHFLVDDRRHAMAYLDRFAPSIPATVRQFMMDRLVETAREQGSRDGGSTRFRQARARDAECKDDHSDDQPTIPSERSSNTRPSNGIDRHDFLVGNALETNRQRSLPTIRLTPVAPSAPIGAGTIGTETEARMVTTQHGFELRHEHSSTGTTELDLVIPALNEEARIGETLAALTQHAVDTGLSVRILVVDNGSVDATADVAAMAGHPDVAVELLSCRTRGKGAAVRAGVLRADAPYVGYCDADLSTPASALGSGLDLLHSGWQVVIGSRRCTGAAYTVPQSALRRLGSFAFRRLAADLSGPITDTQCGFKLFHTDVAKSLFSPIRLTGFAFDVEILARARRAGYRMIELPIRWTDHPDSSFRPLIDGINSFRELREARRTIDSDPPSAAATARSARER